MVCIQNLGAEDEIWKRVKSRLGSFTNLFRDCERDFAGVSYVFFLIVVGEEDLIEFF